MFSWQTLKSNPGLVARALGKETLRKIMYDAIRNSLAEEGIKGLLMPDVVYAPSGSRTSENNALPTEASRGAKVSPYVRLTEILKNAGFNPANPQPPPSGS